MYYYIERYTATVNSNGKASKPKKRKVKYTFGKHNNTKLFKTKEAAKKYIAQNLKPKTICRPGFITIAMFIRKA